MFLFWWHSVKAPIMHHLLLSCLQQQCSWDCQGRNLKETCICLFHVMLSSSHWDNTILLHPIPLHPIIREFSIAHKGECPSLSHELQPIHGARMLICQLVSGQWRKPTFMFPFFFLALFSSQFPFLCASLPMKDNVWLSIRSTDKKGNKYPLFKRKVHKKDASDLCNHLFLDTKVICKSPTWQTSL